MTRTRIWSILKARAQGPFRFRALPVWQRLAGRVFAPRERRFAFWRKPKSSFGWGNGRWWQRLLPAGRFAGWSSGRRRLALLGVAAVLVLAGAAGGVWLYTGIYGSAARRAPERAPITGSVEVDRTVLGCVRGAAAGALSAAVPAAPLAATGVLIPGSAALVATTSVIGCGVGAVSTSTTEGFVWMIQRGREVFAGWLGR